MKKVLIAATLFLIGCAGDPISTTKSNNSEYKIELLFEHDGCKVYRFYDGRYVYWTDCKGKMEQSFSEKTGGKTQHEVYIQNETIR